MIVTQSETDPDAVVVTVNTGSFQISACDLKTVTGWPRSWCVGQDGYVYSTLYGRNGACVRLHRLILNPPPGIMTDHINGDRRDNRRCNLRLANNSENQCNKPRQRRARSKYKGIFRMFTGKPWQARIMKNGRSHYLGTYWTDEEAARAYDAAALELHGEFARINFPAALQALAATTQEP